MPGPAGEGRGGRGQGRGGWNLREEDFMEEVASEQVYEGGTGLERERIWEAP